MQEWESAKAQCPGTQVSGAALVLTDTCSRDRFLSLSGLCVWSVKGGLGTCWAPLLQACIPSASPRVPITKLGPGPVKLELECSVLGWREPHLPFKTQLSCKSGKGAHLSEGAHCVAGTLTLPPHHLPSSLVSLFFSLNRERERSL